MISSSEIRKKYLSFFESKGHHLVPSAPIVVKNDPTLMFTNAGMNQFKDYFLGNKPAPYARVADTQKCLRVSGKHNDLEEVGVDHYHHTMFEMLGNWSFGDYFKKEAIEWAWELLTDVYGLPKDRLYVTVFEGDESEKLAFDSEAHAYWKSLIAEDRIINGNKKDNFWEMGDTGPCGPCSEIHVDMRSEAERAAVDGKTLVNTGHPEVVEIWNLVFMEFNRKADGSLEYLPAKHVDTGMGFERLTRALQGKTSNYDTDIFTPVIAETEKHAGKTYTGSDAQQDIAFRVIADHIRAISFCIADGQLPSNNGAGYVVRRILRRAVRYAYSFLGIRQPFMASLVNVLSDTMGDVFPELRAQKDFVGRVITEEENSFFKTLSNGLGMLNEFMAAAGNKTIGGDTAFELYDTYGFPIDLTELIARENGFSVDLEGFRKNLEAQKARSRADAARETGDWNYITEDDECEFIGYDYTEAEVQIARFRSVKKKDTEIFQLVFTATPFYGESGGQVGDTGTLTGLQDNEQIRVLDTRKENDLIVHYVDKLPAMPEQKFRVEVDVARRKHTAANHSATHLLHAALRKVLGTHVAQKGSLVAPDYLRFDFSHFSKMTEEEIRQVEAIVNEKIRAAIPKGERRDMPLAEAQELGAMALFGEKYGEKVRMITFDSHFSNELCGGTHVSNTANIGSFRIISEGSVAAGVRRIEAVTAEQAEGYINSKLELLKEVGAALDDPRDILGAIRKLREENEQMRAAVAAAIAEQGKRMKSELSGKVREYKGYRLLLERADAPDAALLKDIAFELKNEQPLLLGILYGDVAGKPMITVFAGDEAIKQFSLHSGHLVKELAKTIGGGGGGQPFYATAGGKDAAGLAVVAEKAMELLGA